jgi:hypothetical protein
MNEFFRFGSLRSLLAVQPRSSRLLFVFAHDRVSSVLNLAQDAFAARLSPAFLLFGLWLSIELRMDTIPLRIWHGLPEQKALTHRTAKTDAIIRAARAFRELHDLVQS